MLTVELPGLKTGFVLLAGLAGFVATQVLFAVELSQRRDSAYLRNNIGKRIVIQGTAYNAKQGAMLLVKQYGATVWIERMDSWPDVYLKKQVAVAGVLVVRHDAPVFIHKPGEPVKSGIPVPPGTDLKTASRRYVLTKVEWKRVIRTR